MKPILFLLILSASLFGTEFKYCQITDEAKHAQNQKQLETILEKELASLKANEPPEQKADALRNRIAKIAHQLLQKGFFTEAYSNPDLDSDSIVGYNCFSLWEGESHESIPLTFLVYVWPSEEFALQHRPEDPNNFHYASRIHSHPISCAFAALQGTLFQNNYEVASDRIVQWTHQDIFQQGEGSIDDLGQPFIHQLYTKGSGSLPALSLHVYGLPTEEKVMASFDATRALHTYNQVLQKDGIVKVIREKSLE